MIRATRLSVLVGASLLATSLASTAWAQAPELEMTTPIPPEITTPDSVDTSIGTLEFFDGVPNRETVDAVYDYVDRARAVQAFISAVPGVSMWGIRAGRHAIGATEVNQILIWDTLMDSRSLYLTGNTSTMYALAFLNLRDDGPTVIELPPGMLGALDDMWFRYVEDLGFAGPDHGEGGRYLVLPPGYEGDVPDGYFVVRPQTYGVWAPLRGLIAGGVEAASQNIRNNLRVYPLSQADSPPETEFINVSGWEGLNTVLPNDFSFYEALYQLVQEEPIESLDPETRGIYAAIGIVKGQPFAPDARMRAILTDAVAIGQAYARANTIFPRDPGHRMYGDDSEWLVTYADKDTYFLTDGVRRYDSRLWFHFNAIVVTPAMALTTPGRGSDYAAIGLDSEQRTLDGARTYRLHLPPDPPVADFWAVTLYDTQTRSQLQTDQRFPSLDTYREGLQQNPDGSVDIYFAPNPPEGHEHNWLQTIPGKSWFILLRMYGPLEPWIDHSWRPGEIELVE